MTLQELDQQLRAKGAYPGRPKRSGLIDGCALDAAATAASPCAQCGHQGMDYHSYTNRAGAYIALAVCPACQEAWEF